MERDHERLDELLAQARWLERLARRLVRDPAEADEIVQETWVAALAGRPREQGLRGWLARIARNAALQRGRSEAARRARERSVARPEASDTEQQARERAEAQRRLLEAVLALPEPGRATLILHYFDHLAIDEIARRLGTAEATVRTRLSRGVAELRERLRRENGADWALALAPLVPLRASPFPLPWIGATVMSTGWKYAAGAALAALAVWLAWPHAQPAQPAPDAPQARAGRPSEEPERESGRELAALASDQSRSVLAGSTLAPAAAAAELDVHVRWEDDGRDAAGVGIRLLLWGTSDPFTERRLEPTDASGRAHFAGLAPGRVTVMTDRADGGMQTLVAGERRVVELVIPDGVDVHGRVVDAQKRPVAGANLWLSQYGNSVYGAELARSDAAGGFELRDVGPARYLGARDAHGGLSALVYLPKAQPGQRIEVELVVDGEACALTGTVHDERGQAIEGASVRAETRAHADRDADGHSVQREYAPVLARTDAQGRFALEGLSPRPGRLVVRAPGHAPLVRPIGADEDRATDRHATDPLELVLQREAVVHGRVVDAQGAPLAKASIRCGDYGSSTSALTSSGADGSFRLVGLPSGTLELQALGPAGGTQRQSFTLRPGDDVEWAVQIVTRPGVAGRVLDAAGTPAAGFLVGAITSGHPALFLRSAKSDAQGRFVLGDWPPDADAVEVREPGDWLGLPAACIESVHPGGPELEIRLGPDALRTAWISGRILGADGRPFVAGEIRCFAEATRQGPSVASDAEGRFRFGPLHPGTYRLQLAIQGFAPTQTPGIALAAHEEREVGDLHLEAPAELRVRLLLPANLRPEEVDGFVDLTGADRQSLEIRGGQGRLGGLAPGRYRLQFANDRLRAARVEVELRAHATEEVELRCEPGTSRLVRLVFPAGSQESAVDLRVRDATGHVFLEQSLTRRKNEPLLAGVPGLVLGRYSIEVHTAQGLSGSGELDVVALEAAAILEIELR